MSKVIAKVSGIHCFIAMLHSCGVITIVGEKVDLHAMLFIFVSMNLFYTSAILLTVLHIL